MDRSHRIDLTFSKQFEKAMIERDISPTKLSRISGVPRSQIYRYLAAEISPTTTNIRKLALALNVTADYLLGLK